MPTFLTELLSQLKAIWSKLDGGQRMTIITVGVGAVAFLAGVAIYSSQPDYVTLAQFKGQAELAEMQEALGNLDYKADHNTISIEHSQRDRGLQALAGADLLPKESTDDALMGMASGMTERKAMAWRRLESDAAKAIKRIKGVREATVAGRMVRSRPYIGGENDARSSASVTLKLLQPESWKPTARAARMIVAAKLGIRREDVIVVNAVTSQIDDGSGIESPDSGDFYKQQDILGQDLGLRAQILLDEVYPGRTSVRVSVALDPNWKATIKPVGMDTQLVLEKDKTTDKTEGSGSSGDPGITPKTAPGGPGPAGRALSGGGGTQRSKVTTTTKLSDKTGTERSGMLAPKLERMTVALMLDPRVFLDKEGNKLKGSDGAELDPVKGQEKIEDIVKSAIGFEKGRDDLKTLMVSFEDPVEGPVEAAGPGFMDQAGDYLPMIGEIIALVLVLFFLKGLMKKADLKSSGTGGQDVMEEIPEEDLTPDEQTKRMRKEIEKAIGDDPATVSRMIETWISEQHA